MFFGEKTILVFTVMINRFTFLIRSALLLWKLNPNPQFFFCKKHDPLGLGECL